MHNGEHEDGKGIYHNSSISETALKGIANILETGQGWSGVSALDASTQSWHDWDSEAGNWQLTLQVVKAAPLPVKGAFQTANDKLLHLRAATRYKPVLIGWSWDGGGGHCTVCVGPLLSNAQRFVILDPEFGLTYVDTADMDQGNLVYKPDANTRGVNTASNTFIVLR